MLTKAVRGYMVTFRDNANGTNLVDTRQPIIQVQWPGPGAHSEIFGAWSLMNGKPATECTAEEIIAAIEGDESVF